MNTLLIYVHINCHLVMPVGTHLKVNSKCRHDMHINVQSS